MLNELSYPFSQEGFKLAKMNTFERKVYKEKHLETKENTKLEKQLIFILAILLYSQKGIVAFASVTDPLSKVDSVGYKMLSIVRRVGFWILMTEALIGLIEWGIQNNNAGKKKSMAAFIAFVCLYLIPMLFELVRDSFK